MSAAAEKHISIIGLPGSGKTTLLAALWHMVREPGAVTKLKFAHLSQGNYEHLNNLAKLWRAGKIQQRTQTSGMKTVAMQLKDASEQVVAVSFPDVPGEDFDRMWEERELDPAMVETLAAPAIVLVVNGDTIKLPAWIVDRNAVAKGAGLPPVEDEPVAWSPTLAPTQVRLVELLQMLMSGDLNVGPRRLAILISAWDKVEGEELDPAELVATKLPLLDQYLRSNRDPWTWRVWGLSAQGGPYEDPEKDEHFPETEALRELDRPSDRIKVVDGTATVTDITVPLEWLIS
jgi:energy-coupling factor transporter ATP-binding protein EcfA2